VSASAPDVSAVSVNGISLEKLPEDLYIPPDALKVFLESFEGPLDLLLYLIRKQNLDIFSVQITDITRQYMGYIEIMKHCRFELAAEYLLMAAWLAEIKSRMLLPVAPKVEADEEDPRVVLMARLREYARYKKVTERMDALSRMERENFPTFLAHRHLSTQQPEPTVTLDQLLRAMQSVLQKTSRLSHHHIRRERLSVREKMASILATLKGGRFYEFCGLFVVTEGREGVVVTFLALLELSRESLIDIVQAGHLEPLSVRVRSGNV
jgi:segregation and condensation protein A